MILGLTGGIGCGKSAAAAIFAKIGYSCMDTDAVVAELLEGNSQVLAALREAFGKAVFLVDGRVDKQALAELVFHDVEALNRLESILHPRVFEVWQSTVAAQPEMRWCVEIPLLFEKNLEKYFDYSVCLYCSHPQQLARLAARGLGEEQAKLRIAAQLSLDKKVERADFVITNCGSLAFLEQQILHLNKYTNCA